ncbi:UvrD-helicase domain-containing protein [Cryobacterium sp. PH29-G1]|uniref:UvrD-helicase domain-containing protein n=1 Tax=Cryobacterium sp. PH29-G1 TaxID=3046211 RepID=UPI0024BB247B|nr:UvrD-helicase domain-containing protein [Cryobacterium sp. PH29-G1]MDJ0349542.1 UvrD-helicase domain-containing protein [Cryobacterium sp. PH29-G1]
MMTRHALPTWQPTAWGKALTNAGDWHLALHDDIVTVTIDGAAIATAVEDIATVDVTRGLFWSRIVLEVGERVTQLRGIRSNDAAAFEQAFTASRESLQLRRLIAEFDAAAHQATLWLNGFADSLTEQLQTTGWLTTEFCTEWVARKAAVGFSHLLDDKTLRPHIAAQPADITDTIAHWSEDVRAVIARENQNHLERETAECREFFDRVESSPLTPEQTKAVVCFENRMLVVASAGSGKTSTMVAKAGYALHRNLVPADKILMLAFNASAAKQLQQRTRDRLTPLGLDADKVVARTFHGFGLDVVGQATGKKPSLAPWLEGGKDIEQLGQIVDRLRATDVMFRSEWDFFRAVLARDYPDDNGEKADASDGFQTLQGATVRSPAERIIADWLFFNGVDFIYEKRYEIETADAEHRQYRPDFYYPDINTYHEHWAIDADGSSPFEGYLDDVAWKRQVHRTNGTTLLETTRGELYGGTALTALAKQLTLRGLALQPDADRLAVGQIPVENALLLATFRTFLIHAKSNCLSDEQLSERLAEQAQGPVRYRDASFLRLFTAIRREWNEQLKADDCIDFEDMLTLAAEHLENGDWHSPYDLVMVDEFQDASFARARLARALVAGHARHLFAVGDDWQSINRFAGADLSVMTGFESWFGPSEIMRLERTFRFPQSLADASSAFVLQNPAQISKSVVSSTAEFPPTVGVVTVDSDDAVAAGIRHRLTTLHGWVASGTIPRAPGRKLSVLVLGRYQHQSSYLSDCTDLSDLLDISFRTIHASKGAEADYIVIAGMVSGKWGFPSTIPNDPVLRLAMPEAEVFPKAEERRLFYVALTRARRGVLLVTVDKRESRFVMELIRDQNVVRTNAIGEVLASIVCPRCGRGFMVERTGKRGPFLGCRRYPRCKATLELDGSPPVPVLKPGKASGVKAGVASAGGYRKPFTPHRRNR